MEEHTLDAAAEPDEDEGSPIDALADDTPIEIRYLDPTEIQFSRSPGGVLRLHLPDRCHRRVEVLRTRPLSEPDSYLSVRHGDVEIGIIRSLDELPDEQRRLVVEELEHRYFRPVIAVVRSVRYAHGTYEWQVETDRGPAKFFTEHPRHSVIRLDDGRCIVTDTESNRYEIPPLSKLAPRGRAILRELLA